MGKVLIGFVLGIVLLLSMGFRYDRIQHRSAFDKLDGYMTLIVGYDLGPTAPVIGEYHSGAAENEGKELWKNDDWYEKITITVGSRESADLLREKILAAIKKHTKVAGKIHQQVREAREKKMLEEFKNSQINEGESDGRPN